MEFLKEVDYKELIEALNDLDEKYDSVKLTYIGKSILGRSIPLITLGDDSAKKGVIYVATHHATENIMTSVMLRFIEEYCEAYDRFNQISSLNIRYLYKMRKIYIIPMLNPDGVEYRLKGISHDNPIKDRVIAYNQGEDFSNWNANARGVDLNHNYNAGFEEYKIYERINEISQGKSKFSGEYAESEPEVQALTGFIRILGDELKGLLTFHTQGEEIYCKYNGQMVKGTEIISRHVSRMTSYPICDTEGSASYGGLTDWAIKELNLPSYTLECGKGENPLDIKQASSIYGRLRELMFTFPILF